MLVELCCERKEKPIRYWHQDRSEILIITASDNDIRHIVRQNPAVPSYVDKEKTDVLFLTALDQASSYLHDTIVLDKKATIEIALNHIATEMGKWDTIPGCLFLPPHLLPDIQSIVVTMSGCTCSPIINSIGAEFTVSVVHLPVLFHTGYFVSKSCGFFHEKDDQIAMLIRPVGCFQMKFLKDFTIANIGKHSYTVNTDCVGTVYLEPGAVHTFNGEDETAKKEIAKYPESLIAVNPIRNGNSKINPKSFIQMAFCRGEDSEFEKCIHGCIINVIGNISPEFPNELLRIKHCQLPLKAECKGQMFLNRIPRMPIYYYKGK